MFGGSLPVSADLLSDQAPMIRDRAAVAKR
jgi:hypothetical protein